MTARTNHKMFVCECGDPRGRLVRICGALIPLCGLCERDLAEAMAKIGRKRKPEEVAHA